MIKVVCNGNALPEKKYVLSYLLSTRFGLPYTIDIDENEPSVKFVLPNGTICETSGEFWNQFHHEYLRLGVLPEPMFAINEFAPEKDLVIIYGCDYSEISERKISIGLDVLASIFFMLSRYEEVLQETRDNHNRFPASSSVAYKFGFLERPVVDEYVEYVWNIFKHLDISLKRREEKFKKLITCDLDSPFDPIRRSFQLTARKSVGDLLKRRNLKTCVATVFRYVAYQLGMKLNDRYRDTIDWMMNVNEEKGNKVAFYFIPYKTSNFDSVFELEGREIQSLMLEIHRRGHEIGIHPGYNCYDNATNFTLSVDILRKALTKAGINTPSFGGRMHILRWDGLQTPALWDTNGLKYDSTLAYAEVLGFRCGTCHSFKLFDLKKREALKVVEIPLISMECTVIAERYEGLGYSNKALERFLKYKEICQRYNGVYCLLWHNSHFENENDKKLYTKLI